ncbi:ATPase [Mycobacteroides abscessus subsp. abscessus]|uniref:AAA family ATPase n=1 Tax=Mycobacteroides abscessus TaxID=36809 RepID=UPI00092B15E3|nr:MoxR family ATPase [Mycobacteroides abscessus]SIH36762.1 ATPase [Mycobacteroides abscessus subsp. abscessus]
MESAFTVTPAQLPEMLLNVAVVRPVFLWGAPGIGKSSLVRKFAAELNLDCVTMIGTQLAPEDLIGVPQIEEGRSRFCPPASIARTEPYCLFLDELNAASADVQKAFYSLILDRRIGEYELPEGSIVIGAGNRASDNALARPMASALANRLVHVHLRADAEDWLKWAAEADIHPWVLEYLVARPDHLWSPAPKVEASFSTPRSWHMLSDALKSWGPDISPEAVQVLAHGTLTANHAGLFCGWVKVNQHQYTLDAILKGKAKWPAAAEERDVLHFLANALRARLMKDLPKSSDHGSEAGQDLAFKAKGLIVELAEISLEAAQLVMTPGDDGDLPSWFMIEVARDVPRLAAARQ